MVERARYGPSYPDHRDTHQLPGLTADIRRAIAGHATRRQRILAAVLPAPSPAAHQLSRTIRPVPGADGRDDHPAPGATAHPRHEPRAAIRWRPTRPGKEHL